MRKHTRRGEKFWRKHVEQWSGSGLSQQRYCSEHDLALSSFQRWRRALEEVRATTVVDIVPVLSLASRPEPLPPPASVGVAVAIGRYRVEVPQHFDGGVLSAVLDVLERRGA